ncbi:MAG: energy coupling factor transporter S component ThiW [Nitrososphaerota archaeon]|nr:energy coupling factor transporter S component ThiW [Candidatus Calditenuis fumarioli]
MTARNEPSRTVALIVALSALGLVLAPFFWFPFLGTRAFPGQHLVNVLSGILLGPIRSIPVPIVVGTIRITLGIGTVFAYPGGIPGTIMVGLVHRYVTSRFRDPRLRYLSAFAEPIGTVLIGGTISLLVIGPLLGVRSILDLLSRETLVAALLTFWSGWAVSSVTGSAIGYVVSLVLSRALPELFRSLEASK